MGATGQPAPSAEARKALDGQLFDAAKAGDAAAIERLAAEGASPDAKGDIWTLLAPRSEAAYFNGGRPVTRPKAGVPSSSLLGTPAVVQAAFKGHAGAVSALVRLRADPDATDDDGETRV